LSYLLQIEVFRAILLKGVLMGNAGLCSRYSSCKYFNVNELWQNQPAPKARDPQSIPVRTRNSDVQQLRLSSRVGADNEVLLRSTAMEWDLVSQRPPSNALFFALVEKRKLLSGRTSRPDALLGATYQMCRSGRLGVVMTQHPTPSSPASHITSSTIRFLARL
jgi:hypothetical protein